MNFGILLVVINGALAPSGKEETGVPKIKALQEKRCLVLRIHIIVVDSWGRASISGKRKRLRSFRVLLQLINQMLAKPSSLVLVTMCEELQRRTLQDL